MVDGDENHGGRVFRSLRVGVKADYCRTLRGKPESGQDYSTFRKYTSVSIVSSKVLYKSLLKFCAVEPLNKQPLLRFHT